MADDDSDISSAITGFHIRFDFHRVFPFFEKLRLA